MAAAAEASPLVVPPEELGGPSFSGEELRAANVLGLWASLFVLVGLLVSGPVGLLVTTLIAPQPPWTGPESFIEHYHFIQGAPFVFGFLMVVGFPAVHVAILAGAPPRRRPLALLSLILVAVFAALIGFNYIAQTAIVPAAVGRGGADGGASVALFAMANPSAVCWAIEMYGYGFLGLASIFAAPCFGGSRLERATAALLVANGAVSLLGAGAAFTSHDQTWVQTTAGLIAFAGWNVLIVAMMATIMVSLLRRRRRLGPGIPI